MKRYLVFGIFLIFVLGILFFIWYFYERPLQKEYSDYVDVAISAILVDHPNESMTGVEKSSKMAVTGYEIRGLDIDVYRNGKTLQKAPIIEKLPYNHSYELKNHNLENQRYYTSKINFLTNFRDRKRINLKIIKPGTISLAHRGFLGYNDVLTLLVDSKGYYKDPILCVRWSLHIIDVEINLTEIEIDDNLHQNSNGYTRCYEFNRSLYNERVEIPLRYKFWGKVTDIDFIKFKIMDSEVVNGVHKVSTESGDIGGENAEYVISY